MEIVVATRNPHKLQEIRQILADLPITLLSAADLGAPEVDEDQPSMEGNARKKAREVAAATGKVALADDTGLIVPVLDGRPGVHSARYAGPAATAAQNTAKLLDELKEVPAGELRYALFECVIFLAMVRPAELGGGIKDVGCYSGVLEGQIAIEPRGAGGFGYDSVFLVQGDPQGRTLAELSAGEKNTISHRAGALKMLRAMLVKETSGR